MQEEVSQADKESRQQILDNIEQFGCHLTLIEPDSYLPGFVYSIGLYSKFGHPEIICFGLKTEVMAAIINHACDLIKNGETLVTNRLYLGFLNGFYIQFLKVEKDYYQNYLGYAGWFYKMNFNFPALQLVWPDKQQKFPWEEDFNKDWKHQQPLLDRNIDFKFYEERNVAVYTTKQVINGEPILNVYHNEDGDWQFFSTSEPNLNDTQIVCFEEITKLDSSINEIFHLQYGWRAWRENAQGNWQYVEDSREE